MIPTLRLRFQGSQCLDGFGEKKRIGSHVDVGFLDILFSEFFQAFAVGYAGQDGERFFQRLADGPFDGRVGYLKITVPLQHMLKAGDDAARGVGKCIVEVEQISRVIHWSLFVAKVVILFFFWQISFIFVCQTDHFVCPVASARMIGAGFTITCNYLYLL